MDWDQYFMKEAYNVAMKSKDKSTQVGCIVVGPDNEIRASGYNSFPRGWTDDDPRNVERPFKYSVTEHSERNAIYNAARIGVSLKGCTLYVPWFPCCDCARGIIQAGITEVVLHKEFRWGETPGGFAGDTQAVAIAKELFDVCGVKVRYWSGTIPATRIRHGGKLIDPTTMEECDE